MAINLDAIKKKLAAMQTASNRSNLQWKPEPGTTILRIVPNQFQIDNPFTELYFHYNISKRPILSLSTFNESDPIVEFSDKLKQTGNKEDWKLGKKMEPKLRTYVPVIIRGKEKEGIKFWAFGKEIYTELLKTMSDPDYGDITDPMHGRDITVEYQTPAEAKNDYGKMTIRMKPSQSPISTDTDLVTKLLSEQPNIFDIYKKSTYAEIAEALDKYMNSSEETETDEAAATTEEVHDTPPAAKMTDIDKELDDLFPAKPAIKSKK